MNQTILLLSMLFANTASAADITISPYLQSATTDAIWVLWETNTGSESTVEWGTTKGLGSTTTGTTQTGDGFSVVHEVQLTGLSANTKYYYRTVTSDAASAISHFVTPPEHQDESSFSIVAVSDMQNDYSNPTVFDEIIHDGVIETVTANWGADMAEEIGLVMIPGDLVDNGWIYSQWRDTFFDPASTLMAQVPFYPVPGNHEANSPYFFNLFHLPENGSQDSPEHWWWTDYGNLRIVGLDSNWPYTEGDQLEWLRALMDETCAAEEIDFVFAQLHHPYKSELWIAGELDFTGEVIDVMQAEGINQFILIGENVLNFHFSDDCYYEEWFDEVTEEDGWIALLNFREHVVADMQSIDLDSYFVLGGELSELAWRTLSPAHLYQRINDCVSNRFGFIG